MTQAVLVAEPKAVEFVEGDILRGSTNVKTADQKISRIQVSKTKKPLFFYLNLAKRYIKQHNHVELSALGMAIPTIIIIAEILKANGLAVQKTILTSTVSLKDENKGRLVHKAKLKIVLEKSDKQKNHADTESDSNPTENESKLDVENNE
ncbi:hypothetical protein Nepgr_030349 [Nepenthes gracilis]|uniref:DNA/RNA-binding protein Alba-like domain-containing protein n=1 Tax=Nepenthes gracilis TaxID=150966 RepID=A0AAD3TGI7_NEPGR|nr:hypothetical protein Nepgr_030349 [Nepenthes gracilis]